MSHQSRELLPNKRPNLKWARLEQANFIRLGIDLGQTTDSILTDRYTTTAADNYQLIEISPGWLGPSAWSSQSV